MSLKNTADRYGHVAQLLHWVVVGLIIAQVVLASGRTLHVSGKHPTADGRTFDDLRAGSELGGVLIVSAREVAYEGNATYDLLPASSTGTYVADGVLIGSTQRGPLTKLPAPQ